MTDVKRVHRRGFKAFLRTPDIFVFRTINNDAGVFIWLPISFAVSLLLGTVRTIKLSNRFERIFGLLVFVITLIVGFRQKLKIARFERLI